MTKRLLVAAIAATSIVGASPALAGHRHHHSARGAAQGGNSNKGDVWVDTVNVAGGPGHEMDPHLPCANINLWGDKLADPSGTYTIDGWPPSGSGKTAYGPTGWSYTGPGIKVISTINVLTLITNAVNNGDVAQPQQGFHFKLQFSQDPQKHKTFWVRCSAPGVSLPPPPPPGGPPPPPGNTPQTGTTAPSTGVTVQAPSTAAPKAQVKAKKKSKKKVLAKRLRRKSGFTG